MYTYFRLRGSTFEGATAESFCDKTNAEEEGHEEEEAGADECTLFEATLSNQNGEASLSLLQVALRARAVYMVCMAWRPWRGMGTPTPRTSPSTLLKIYMQLFVILGGRSKGTPT